MSGGRPIESRLQTASDPAKAFRQYDDLRKTKRLKRAMIVAELQNGSYRVLGQMAAPLEMAQLCWVAAQALQQVPEDQRADLPEPPPPPPQPKPTLRGAKPVYSIAAAWAGFEQAVFSDGVSAVQRQEMRRAFYGGASSLFDTIMAMLDPGEEPTEAELGKMDALHEELVGFAEDLQAGRA